MFCVAIGQFFAPGVLPVGIKERVKRLRKWLSERRREQKHLGRHRRPICTTGGTTRTPVFALEMERSKNSTNHIMKGQMDFIWSGEEEERERWKERDILRMREGEREMSTKSNCKM